MKWMPLLTMCTSIGLIIYTYNTVLNGCIICGIAVLYMEYNTVLNDCIICGTIYGMERDRVRLKNRTLLCDQI